MKLENLKGFEKYTQKLGFRRIAQEMCNPNFLIRLFVSDKYSYDTLPGYMTIPYNFEFSDLIQFYQQNKNELHRIKERVNFVLI
jgi:hypothetical protein